MNKYVSFISDTHFLACVENLHNSYLKAKNNIDRTKFYNNKIDTIKLTFDAKFNKLSEQDLIAAEISRQIDKSINNAIGTFHEEILGGIIGYSKGNLSGYDIKANNDTLFADIKNKHNTMNSGDMESLYQTLERFANQFPNAKCYWVQILAKSSFNQKWQQNFGTSTYNHPNVYKISGDQFYDLLTGQKESLFELYKSLPMVIDDYLQSISANITIANSALAQINQSRTTSGRSLIDEITFDNFSYYLGFNKL
jgi:hypothetical protein